MAQPPYVVCDLLFDAGEKRVVKEGVGLAGKRKVLPDENAPFVAGLVKFVAFIVAAAPDADHVHVGKYYRVQEVVEFLLVKAGDEAVRRNIIGSLDK